MGDDVAMHRRWYRQLSADERETVSLGLAWDHSLRVLVRLVGRSPSTGSHKVARTVTQGRPASSLHGAHNRRWSGRSARGHELGGSSPEQIAGRLQRADPDHMGRHVSTEPIYAAR